jgi:hypothetical protein
VAQNIIIPPEDAQISILIKNNFHSSVEIQQILVEFLTPFIRTPREIGPLGISCNIYKEDKHGKAVLC